MSIIDRQTMSSGVSRRTVVRGVAWSVPAVSIAVAAPAFATSHEVISGAATSGTPIKRSVANVKHVIWTLTLANTGTVPLTAVSVDFTFVDNSGKSATALSVISPSGTWTVTSLAELVAVYNGTVPVGGSVTFTADFTNNNQAAGKVTAMVYEGGTLLDTEGPVDYIALQNP